MANPIVFHRASARFAVRAVDADPSVELDELALLTAALAETDGALVERVRALLGE